MTKTEAIAWLEVMKEDAIFEQNDALKMAIEALQSESTHCRLIDADALILLLKARKQFFIDSYGGSFHTMSEKDKARCDEIDACIASIVNAFYDEDDYWNDRIPTHGRLIDADALMEYCSNQKSKTISNNDIARFPTVQIADKPHGEWIEEYTDANGDKWYRCSHCGERFVLIEKGEASTEPYHFCPNCEADMRQKK